MDAVTRSGEPTPERMQRVDFAWQQEIQCLKDHYKTEIRMLQDTHDKEKRALKQENHKLRSDVRIQKIINIKLRRNNATMMEAGAALQTELQQVKLSMKKLQENKDVDKIEIMHRREKRILMERARELKNFVRSLKMTNNNLKKDREERVENQNKLQQELTKLRAINNNVQKKFETVLVTEERLRTELARMKTANKNLNKYSEFCEEEEQNLTTRIQELQKEMESLESKTKACEEEKQILTARIQELQKDMEAMKNNASAQSLQLVGSNSERQQDHQCVTAIADDGKVSINNFQFVRRLGEGAFGTVVLAKGKIHGGPEQLYAIKSIQKQSINSSNICDLMAEKETLMLTSGHPFITTLYCCFQDKDHVFFAMEYMSGGDLKNQLDNVGVFSEEKAKFYAAEISLAVQYLHLHGILHRDLKLENVLVDSDGHCKIADFGLCKLGLFRHCRAWTQCGTPFCMAPEIVKNFPYGQGVDWWAVGVIIFEMMTGNPPFYYNDQEDDLDDERTRDGLNKKILHDEVQFPEHMSLAAKSILTQLLMKDPKQRLGSNGLFDEIREHPFFKGIDWKALQEKRVKPPEKENFAKNPERDNETFSKVLKVNSSPRNNQNLFEGFSFINYKIREQER
jgi:serine/threonine protein kinase/outer membrane murein-binding lipoprotein Lpp